MDKEKIGVDPRYGSLTLRLHAAHSPKTAHQTPVTTKPGRKLRNPKMRQINHPQPINASITITNFALLARETAPEGFGCLTPYQTPPKPQMALGGPLWAIPCPINNIYNPNPTINVMATRPFWPAGLSEINQAGFKLATPTKLPPPPNKRLLVVPNRFLGPLAIRRPIGQINYPQLIRGIRLMAPQGQVPNYPN
jgi:hypothetical protein